MKQIELKTIEVKIKDLFIFYKAKVKDKEIRDSMFSIQLDFKITQDYKFASPNNDLFIWVEHLDIESWQEDLEESIKEIEEEYKDDEDKQQEELSDLYDEMEDRKRDGESYQIRSPYIDSIEYLNNYLEEHNLTNYENEYYELVVEKLISIIKLYKFLIGNNSYSSFNSFAYIIDGELENFIDFVKKVNDIDIDKIGSINQDEYATLLITDIIEGVVTEWVRDDK